MPAGRPNNLIDFPSRTGERTNLRERAWLEQLTDRFDAWRDIVDLDPAERIEIEVPLVPNPEQPFPRSISHCRADAIVWHSADRITIIEAKVASGATDVCCAIGQLIYYKTLAETYWGVEVAALVVASAYLPPFVLDCIANVQAPIRFLKRDAEDNLSGLVPRYLQGGENGRATA